MRRLAIICGVLVAVCGMPAEAQTTGSISGTVVAAGGAPVASINLTLYGADGKLISAGSSNGSGGFLFTPLAAGTYYLLAQSNGTYVQEIYDGIHCTTQGSSQTSCNPRTGTPIVVTAGQTTTIVVTLDVGGRITGRLLEAATGQPVGSTSSVALYDRAGVPVLGPGVSQVPGADGTFTFGGLAAGTYFVRSVLNRFITPLLDEIYNNRPCFTTVAGPASDDCEPTLGTPIVVTLGATTSGIDLLLDPGGTIAGTLSFEGLPDGVTTTISAFSGGVRVAQTTLSGPGSYAIRGLPSGTYVVRGERTAGSYVDTWYGGASVGSGQPGNPVAVTAGATTSGIDIQLRLGGAVQGNITIPPPPFGFPRVAEMAAYNAAGVLVKSIRAGTGAYTIDGLPAGTYYVRAEDPVHISQSKVDTSTGFLIPKLYNDIVCVNERCAVTSGTPVMVVTGQATKGIDFTLENGASISGAITPSGASDAMEVELYDASGVRVRRTFADHNTFFVPPTPSVNYVARGLPAGVYYLRTISPGFVDEAYNDVPCEGCPPTTGTPIVLAAGEDRTGVNFDLVRAPFITGTVTDASSAAPLSNVTIELYSPAGQIVGTAISDNAGGFSVSAAPGTYYARTVNARGYADETYSEIACAGCPVTAGTPIVVGAGGKSGVNFTLAQGSLIDGSVVSASGALPLSRVPITLFTSAGAPAAQATSTSSGAWRASVVPGTYYARTEAYPGYRQQLYKDLACPRGLCVPTTGTPIAVSSNTSGIAFALPACGALTMAPAAAPGGSVGSTYRLGLMATSASAPVTFTIASGTLPAGLTLDAATGVISGTPTAAGTSTFTVALSDALGCATTKTYSIDVSSCSTTVALSTSVFVPTFPGPGIIRVDAGPNYFTMPAAGGRMDMGYLGTCTPQAVFGNTFVSDPWLHVTGPTIFRGQPQPSGSIEVDPNASGTQFRTGYIVFNGQTIQVRQAPIISASPFGVIDLPGAGATVTGSVPVSGWALDDLGVSRVRIFRASVAPEAPGTLVFIGDGSFVRGARPDVERFYRSTPNSDRAGWGYLLLSNVLPNQGNGTFTLYAFADDPEGHGVLLGTKQITADNAHATVPFGTIDTPAEGATISGSAYVSFGWALTPQPKLIPTDGSTVQISIDSQIIGTVDYNHFRQDIFNTFPTLANANGAVGLRILDTTQLNDGMHTIGWLVTDNQGAAAGIGSRYFTVQNNGVSSSLTASVGDAIAAGARVDAGRRAASLASLPAEQRRVVVARPLERIEFTLDFAALEGTCAPTYAGYDASSGELRALPVGSSFDGATGQFQWQPGPGFIGTYELLFVRTSCAGARERVPVRVVITAR